MSQVFDFVAGSTFLFDAVLQEGANPVDLTSWQIEASLHYQGSLVCNPSVSITSAAEGKYRILVEAPATKRWPAGIMSFGLRYVTAGGQVVMAQPVTVSCKRV